MRNVKRNIKTRKTEEGKRYYRPLKYPDIPLSQNDLYVTTTIGDRLDLLANQFYNDVRLWWVISSANPNKIRRDSFNLKPGIEIRIPSNPSAIVKVFENMNK
jgi:hypothetical protein